MFTTFTVFVFILLAQEGSGLSVSTPPPCKSRSDCSVCLPKYWVCTKRSSPRETCFADVPDSVEGLELSGKSSCAKVLDSSVLGRFPNLTSLRLWNMGITNISADAFKNNKKLISINLAANNISRIEANTFSDVPLSKLIISMENSHPLYIAPGFLGNVNHMKYLEFVGDSITNMNDFANIVGNKVSIDKLVLFADGITDIPAGFFPNTRIGYIAMRLNDITTLKNNVFKNIVNLTSINFQSNKLHTIEPQAFVNPTLDGIWLLFNNITEFPSEAVRSIGHRLKYFEIANNKISILRAGALNGSSISHLSLESNPIKKVEKGAFAGITDIHWLDLSNSEITSLPDDIEKALQGNSPGDLIVAGIKGFNCSCDSLWLARYLEPYHAPWASPTCTDGVKLNMKVAELTKQCTKP